MAALGITGPKKSGVNGNQDPGAALPEDGAQEETSPNGDLKTRDDRHGSIVVLLDESTDRIGHGVRRILGLAVGRSTGSGGQLLGREDCGDEISAGVCRDVEDGVNAIGKEGERVLGHEQPNNGHH